MIKLERDDFDCIGQVAKHCNYEKLCIAVEEASIFDLKPLLCDIFWEVEANWDDEDEIWTDLINGSDYIGCGGKTKKQMGLKRVLTYFAYSRYLLINTIDDTPNGSVTKTNQWSIPKPMKDIYANSNRYRTMGEQLWKDVESYLCINRDVYEGINLDNCSSCGCNGSCGEYVNTRGFGLSGSNVSKYD